MLYFTDFIGDIRGGVPYFCSNLVKLDELGKICNDSVETLLGYFWEIFLNSTSGFEKINNLENT